MIVRKLISVIGVACFAFSLLAQSDYYNFGPSFEHPFGLPNPEAPAQLLDYAPLIGENICRSVRRNADQTWGDTVEMTWRFKYIMNGMAVQDETFKTDGQHSGSIRQYISDSSRWYVHYYSSTRPSTTLPAWEGNKTKNGDIILYRKQKAPNGMDGFYKINFTDNTKNEFNWLGEWVNGDESITYPTWKIFCKKEGFSTDKVEIEKILANTHRFSKAYVDGDYDFIALAHAPDAKSFPGNEEILQGRESIKDRWTIKNGSKILYHESFPEEIKILGQYAYDYGYYMGRTETKNSSIIDWKGKYVIVWKKVNDEWKIYLDIWNRVP